MHGPPGAWHRLATHSYIIEDAMRRATAAPLVSAYAEDTRASDGLLFYSVYFYVDRCGPNFGIIVVCSRQTAREHILEAAPTGRVEQRRSCLVTFSAGVCAGASKNALFFSYSAGTYSRSCSYQKSRTEMFMSSNVLRRRVCRRFGESVFVCLSCF